MCDYFLLPLLLLFVTLAAARRLQKIYFVTPKFQCCLGVLIGVNVLQHSTSQGRNSRVNYNKIKKYKWVTSCMFTACCSIAPQGWREKATKLKIRVNKPGRQKVESKNPWQQVKHAWILSDMLQT